MIHNLYLPDILKSYVSDLKKNALFSHVELGDMEKIKFIYFGYKDIFTKFIDVDIAASCRVDNWCFLKNIYTMRF